MCCTLQRIAHGTVAKKKKVKTGTRQRFIHRRAFARGKEDLSFVKIKQNENRSLPTRQRRIFIFFFNFTLSICNKDMIIFVV